MAGGFKGPEDGGKWGRRWRGHRGSSGEPGLEGACRQLPPERLGTDFGPWRFPCVSFSILGWLLLVREFSASRGKPRKAGAGSARLPRALPRPWGALQHPGEGRTRVGMLARPREGHPFPALRVPSRMFPTCDPVGLLDLIPQQQFADVKPWRRPKRAARGSPRPWEGDGERSAGRRGKRPRQALSRKGDHGVAVITVTWKPCLRTEDGGRLVARAGDSRPRAGSSPSSAVRSGLGTHCASTFLICQPQNSSPPRLGFKETVFIILPQARRTQKGTH